MAISKKAAQRLAYQLNRCNRAVYAAIGECSELAGGAFPELIQAEDREALAEVMAIYEQIKFWDDFADPELHGRDFQDANDIFIYLSEHLS